MKKSLIISSALVLGMSSVAMADSFSFGAKASVSWNAPAGVQVRDHRRPAPSYQTQTSVRPSRYNVEYGHAPYQPPSPALPAGLDCRNWDPTFAFSDPCANYFSTGYSSGAPHIRGWNVLGVRESAVADNQFMTINDGRSFGRLKLRAESGSPIITKVAIRFMDNTTQVINVGGRLNTAVLRLSPRPINQIVVYTAAGSRGTYSLSTR